MESTLKYAVFCLACATGPTAAAVAFVAGGSEALAWTVVTALLSSAALVLTDEGYVDGQLGIATTVAAMTFPLVLVVLAWRIIAGVADVAFLQHRRMTSEPSAGGLFWEKGEPPRDGRSYCASWSYGSDSTCVGIVRWIETEEYEAFVDWSGEPIRSGTFTHHCPAAVVEVTKEESR